MAKKETSALVVQASVVDVVNRLNKKAGTDIRALDGFSIRTVEQYDEAAKRVSRLKILRKEADTLEKSVTDPANLIIKNARTIFKPFKDKVNEVEMVIKEEMIAFINSREKKAEQLLESNKKVDSKLISKVSELQNTKSNHASARKIATLEITDATLIPREYLVPDEVKIKAALQSGKKVKGCQMVLKTSIAI